MFLFYTCRSFIGFQSCSTNITVSAPVKFRPSPPTCVVNNRMSMEGSLLNLKKYKEKVSYNTLSGIVNYVDLLGRIER